MAGFVLLWVLVSCLAFASVGWAQEPDNDALRLNELRFKGTHNSYHKRPFIPLSAKHRYTHDSLFAQLEFHGVRALELDLHKHGEDRYRVYHIRYIDSRTTCRAFEACLRQIRSWMDANPRHEPLMIWLEAKDFAGGQRMKSLRGVDPIIRRILGDRLITPDDVRGAHPSLRSALSVDGWPTLGESRGKALFMLIANDRQREEYTSGFSHLRGRVLFVEARPDQYAMPWASVAKAWLTEPEDIQLALEHNLLLTATVCTAGMKESSCRRVREQLLASGVSILVDDFVRPTRGRDYYLALDHETVGRTPKSSLPRAAPVASGSPGTQRADGHFVPASGLP